MDLNPQQREAVEHGEGPLLVLAGPGSGKTRVLVHRIASLVERGLAAPSEILAVTFTNKAAGEMRRRIEGLVGPAARELSAGTFHSVCLRLLRRNPEPIGYGENFVVFDESDSLSLVKECMDALNIDRDRIPPQSVQERISRAKDSCQGPAEFASASAGNPFLERVARIYSRYQERLAELQAMDFGDLIRLSVELFRKDPAFLDICRRRWRHVLVDEYQDTNRSQYLLLSALAEGSRSVCVVGDDDQSIYRWRGADISNILRFEKDFPGAAVVRLEQNYRSTGAILSAAGAVVARNTGRKPKGIWTENARGRKVSVVSCESEMREAEFVAGKVSSLRAFRDAAIFYRTNAQSRPFEDAFRAAGIPYRIYGGMKFYERAEVKDVLAYLRLALDPKDDVSFRRVINVPARGLGKTTVEKLFAFAQEKGLSMMDAIAPFVASGGARPAAARALSDFAAMADGLRAAAVSESAAGLLKAVLDRSGYVESLASVSSIESEAKLENINELVTAVEEFVPYGEGLPIRQFLDQAALVSGADDIDEERGAVTMMTLHLAKGLEYPEVFMVGMEEGLFPHSRSQDDPDELEEERRLCYVGMTRAMEGLTLTHAFRRRLFGSERYNVASRFLDEMPKEHVERLSTFKGSGSGGRRPEAGSRKPGTVFDSRFTNPESRIPSHGSRATSHDSYDFDQRPPEEAGGYAKGLRVRHPTFGVGVIRACEKTSAGHKVTVSFHGGATKKLIAEFAGLVPA